MSTKPNWFSHVNQQLMFPHIMDDPEHEHHYWLSRYMISPLVGDFFETVTSQLTKSKIIANSNGDSARFGAADLIGARKDIIEVKGTVRTRSDYTFGSRQLVNYHNFHEAGYNLIYYLWEYEKSTKLKLTSFRTEEKLFEFLAGAVVNLTILKHEDVWPFFPKDKIDGIWFEEVAYVRLYKKILRPELVLKGESQLKINGLTLR